MAAQQLVGESSLFVNGSVPIKTVRNFYSRGSVGEHNCMRMSLKSMRSTSHSILFGAVKVSDGHFDRCVTAALGRFYTTTEIRARNN